MNFNDIKFSFKIDSLKTLEDIFEKIVERLNVRFNENLKPYISDSKEKYTLINISSSKPEEVEKIIDSFFSFKFNEIIDVALYRFLVLENNDEYIVLANINSLIFDYSSINLLNNNYEIISGNVLKYYDELEDYMNSSEFEKDESFWKNNFLDIGNYVKFYNLKSDEYKNIKIHLNNKIPSNLFNDNDNSKFKFFAAIFALYLSRVNRANGCLLKTTIPANETDISIFDKNALLKIECCDETSFSDYVDSVDEVFDVAEKYTKIGIDNYIKDELSYYSVFDFTNLHDVNVFNGEGGALTLNVYGEYLEIIYNAGLFSDEYMHHMVENIEFLIDEALSSQNHDIKRMNIISMEEQRLLSDFCKGKTVEVDKDNIFSQGFREHATINPSAIAVDDGINQISYGDLEKSSNSLAYDLKENYGIGLGDHVAVMLPRDYHFPEIVLALNKIGATFIPIDLLYPVKRIEYMLDIGDAKCAITTKEISKKFDLKINTICIEDLNYDYDFNIDITRGDNDLFAIMFTSGTTGLPKGVMISNKMTMGAFTSLKNVFNLSKGDVAGCYLSFSFVGSLLIFVALFSGGCSRIFNEKEQKDSLLLIKNLKETHMNSLILPPSVGIPIFENEDINLDYLVLSGAKLDKLNKIESSTQIINFYGTTEIIIGITKSYNIHEIKDNHVPIGRPVTNTWIYILDENGNQMPIGVPGEICVSNDFLSPGYYKNPEMTKDSFISNPYCDCEDNSRMYRTGDIGFYNFDGEIEIIGREDGQLSVRGFRIESNEILNIMNRFKEISQIYLDVEYDNLVAYYTTKSDLDIECVKNDLKSELPYYMIPSLFVELENIPLTPNGKIDKNTLESIFTDNSEIDIEDEILDIIIDSFKEVLNHNRVLIDDDFVELGGNSLYAMNLQMLLKNRLGVNLSSNDLIELSTPINIANHIRFSLNSNEELTVKYSFDDYVPLSESQLNVYLDESVNDMGTSYNNPFKLDFTNLYSVDEIKNAIYNLLNRFPVFRAHVVNYDDVLSFNFDADIEVHEGNNEDACSFVRPFDLKESLVRFLIVENDDSIFLYVDCHHLIFDGVSSNIILNNLLDILEGFDIDGVDDGVLKQISYEEDLDSDYMVNAERFFDELLVNRDEVNDLLPCVGQSVGGEYFDEISVDDSFNSFLIENNITHNQLFASVFGYTLSRFTGSSKILFYLIENGRWHVDLSDSVGMFVRTLPVLMECSNQDVKSFIDYSSDLINSVVKNDLYPFRILANKFDLDLNITFQYDYNLHNKLKDNYLNIERLSQDTLNDLGFCIYDNGENDFEIKVLYSSKFSDMFIKSFVDSFKLILNGFLSVKELSDINYTYENDLMVLDDFNQTETSLAYEDILDAFNDNLSKYPENNLVSYCDVSYTYGESAFIADKLAKSLVDLGVESQDSVGFLVPRSELYMFCIMGIMSMGGVYVPLDDNLPDDRIKFMLEDTESKVIIVSDETYQRACNIVQNAVVLNISEILMEELDTLSSLPVVYGDLACILYTSGTTGVPKGVKITRKAIPNVSQHYCDTYNFKQDDNYGLFSVVGFDTSNFIINCVMYVGACLTVVPEEIRLNVVELNKYFIAHGVTHSFITTQVAKLFMESVDETSLDLLLVGGEKLGDFKDPEDYNLLDGYGPTESFAFVSSIINSDKMDSSSIGPLGYNIKAYILDDEFRRVPIGAVGELYLTGYQLSNGYLNREDETANAFLANPFDGGENYDVMYRTGDMMRMLPDGTLGIVGRRDSQVKIRGNRVELSEVESVIRELDYVVDLTVQTINNGANNELVAYVVVSEEIDEGDLSDNISQHIYELKPDYMVPSFIVKLDSIPLTVNGKVDKRALPKIDVGSLRVDYVAPSTESEKQIVNAFETVFNQKDIGLNDDFIRLGGDSFTAIRVISSLQKNNLNVSARDILNYKTPYLIAKHVSEQVEKVHYDAVEGVIDLLPIQSYFFDKINLNNYVQEFVLKSSKDLNIDILQKSFDELSNVHDMLRAIYRHENDRVIQEILPLDTSVFKIKEHFISDNLEINLKKIYNASKNTIDIENRLFDVNLIHYGDECYLMLVCHHLIIDGVSWNILIDDLTHIYSQIENNNDIDVKRPYPYKNWIDEVRNLVEDISEDEKKNWIKINSILNDDEIKGKTKIFSFNVDAGFDVDNLFKLSEEEYWALIIARTYKKTFDKDIIFNRESHGRDENITNLNRTIGWFTSQYPVPVNVDKGYDNVSLINDVHSIKTAFNSVNNLGLNYGSLIYMNNEFEYKHCPVTLNFLGSEFIFENQLFKSMNQHLFNQRDTIDNREKDSYGITLNISRADGSYIVNGDYTEGTFIGDKFNEFISNIKSEFEFISNYKFDDGIVCQLSEPQLGVYLDEMINDKGTAYSVPGFFECGNHSVEEIKEAISALIDKHPILKGRILDNEDVLLLVCDSNPSIEVSDTDDYSQLIKPFNLNESLARFFIINKNDENMIVFFDMHHIIADAPTRTIINKELNDALNDKLDSNIDLGFIKASNDSFESKFEPQFDNAKEFFTQKFMDIEDVQYLINDVDGSMGRVSLYIKDIRNKVELFAHENGITVGNFLNSVFAYTYSRFTGSDKVYFNFTVNGRQEDYAQDVMGMFVRTIPVVVDCKNRTIKDYVNTVSDLILESMVNSVYPFRLLASEFDLNNSVLFEYNYDLNDVSDIGEDIVFSDYADSVAEFSGVVNDLDDGFVITINHLDKFSQNTAERFVKVFKEVLIQFLEKEELGDINYISNSDLTLLDDYNQTEHSLVYEDILDAFNDNLSKNPDNMLVQYNDVYYSYAEGAFIADKIAKHLVDLGVKSNDNVAFLVERSELYMFCVLGIMSIGGVYVPLDDNLPDGRISFMLNDTSSKVLIVSDETYDRVDDIVDEDILILNISELINDDVDSLNYLPVVCGELACILYTSGSTDLPKGVKITRESILNFIDFHVNDLEILQGDVYGLFASIGFDVAMAAIFSAIYAGACLNVIPDEIKLNIVELNRYFVKYGVTHTYITTQVAKLFIKDIKLSSLKVLVAGGEKLGEINESRHYRIVDAYGPTEACVYVISADTVDKIDSSSVGYVQNNMKAYILDDEFRRVPIGAVGELFLSGCQLADGYLNRDEETDHAFLNNPFEEDEDYKLLYRTGDMARLLSDGSYGIVGRRDSQVKIRGNRLELSEVESVIRDMDCIEDVTVQTVKNNENYELVAYVVSDKKNSLKETVCDYIASVKPDYMVPSFVMALDEIPLNVNGKVDKKALPEVDLDSLHEGYVAPRNETEKIIVESFEKVFNHDSIGIYDDFTLLGGDSLTAIRLLSYLEGYNVSAADVLSLRTPYAIAKIIKEDQFDLDVYSLETGCPLNEPQLNVYLDIVANNKIDSYLIPINMNISKKYSVDKLVDTLNKMMEVHPILGMCVSDDFEVPYLIKGSKPQILVKSDVDDDYVREFITKPFDLKDSLSRFLIVENDDDYSLFAVFHHIIFDRLSDEVFKHDLLSIINGELISVDDSFLKVAAFTKQIPETEEFNSAKSFFDNLLADSDDVGVLLDDVCADGLGVYRSDLKFDISKFKEFINVNNVSENVLFTSVFAYTLSRFVGGDEVVFGIVENGRDRFNNFNSIGMFVNTLPIFVDCKNQRVSSFMAHMSDLIYDVMRYNYYPFRLLANEHNINSDILFQYVPEWVSENESIIFDDVGSSIINEMNDLITDFNVDVTQKGENYNLTIFYSDKYSKNTIEHFSQTYNLILSQIINVNELSEINLIENSDIDCLNEYNQTETSFGYDDILDAYNDNLVEYEDNILVGYGDNIYTHGQGAFIANEIGNRLTALNIFKQDSVALFVNRSEWFLLASMGVLSKGAVYVPIETSYPDNRIVLMLGDSGSKIVIVDDYSEQRMNEIISENKMNVVVLNVSDIIKGNVASSNHLEVVDVVGTDVACVLYTSGTTGNPKGTLVTRNAVNNFVSWYVDETGFTCDDAYGMHCSYVFDMHTHALYSPVISGGSLYIVPENIRLDLKALNEFYVNHNCTHTYITSQVGKLFAESGMETTIKLLCFGGMKLGELNAPDSIGPFETYGPSENLAVSTSIFANDRIHHSSIGRFISNVKGYVLDHDHRRVPIGAVGELYLSGHQLSKGYLNREEENNNSFFMNPFDDISGYERIYATGDLVRFLPDGTLGIVGRLDSQVKIRGNRVELGEVEFIIRQINGVIDVTVQAVNNELVAYIVTSNELESKDLVNHVREYVGEHKPDYMIPSFVIKLDSIPVNVNGKVDRKALPEVDLSKLRAEYKAPSNEEEKLIVEGFENVFNHENIGIDDNFIALGGDSLTAIKLINHLKDYNISLAEILSLKTPRLIAKNIRKMSYDLDIFSVESGCPLNEPQLNVYLDIIANNKFDSYLIPFSLKISKKHSVKDIINALEDMLESHPILKMRVLDDNDNPYLIKGSKPQILHKQNVNDDFINEFLGKPFDLNKNLCRFLIVENNDEYKMFAVFHHIIFDGFSNYVFERDFYSILDGENVEVDDSFLKVSAFNQEMNESDSFVEAKEYYEYLLDDREDVGMLLDCASSDGPGICKGDLEIDFNAFKSFLDAKGISENVLFTGVFAYALSWFVGSDKVLFNIAENGRDRFKNYDSIGMYVNILAMIIDCKNQDIDSYLNQVSDIVYTVMKYNYYPFRLLANEYDIDSNIIFQFLPQWRGDNGNSLRNEFAHQENMIGGLGDLNNDFMVEVIQNGEKYSLVASYSDKYSKDMVERFIYSYKSILSQIISVDRLSDLDYISESDLQCLDNINNTVHPLIYEDILDAFNDNLSKYPNNRLVSYKDVSYTYAEGAFISDKLAEKLSGLGVNTKDNVAFLVERSELYMFSVLGILSIGAVYVPIDDKLPDERIGLILNDTQSKVVIVSDETCERVKGLDYECMLLNISDLITQDKGTVSKLDTTYSSLACILYTSGTTGIPKGVKITRKSAVNVSQCYADTYGMDRDDNYGMFSTIGFDAGALAIFSAIYAGACLSIIPEAIRMDMTKLNEYMIEQGITHTMLNTQVGKLFIQNTNNTSLNVLLVGGEKLGECENPNEYQLVDGFGPTETFSFISSIDNTKKMIPSSIGHLNYNTKVYVLDNMQRRVPYGAVGELCISGIQVSEGYLNRNEETAKSFISNPFDDNDDYNVLYCTGDLVRFLPDGSLDIIGRRDNQVKIRGNRVELSEIESAIREIDYVKDVTVQTVKHGTNNELVAYVVSDKTEDLKDSICNYIANIKPEYMVPSFVIKLDNIPLNINGKVDRKLLPEVNMEDLHVEYVAPSNIKEMVIVDAFEKVFDQERIGVNDDFVLLGGDSLSAIKLLTYLKDYNISVADVLSLRTPLAIANNLDDTSYDTSMFSLESGFPMNVAQLNVYLDIIAHSKFDSYLVPIYMEISKKYSLQDIYDAIDEILRVHPILGMCVSKEHELPHLMKGSKPPVIFESELRQDLIVEFCSKHFDLYDSMARFLIIETEDSYLFGAVFHHIVFDALSQKVFKKDFNIILDGGTVDVDENFLRTVAFNLHMRNSEKFTEASDFYDSMLVDIDKAGVLAEETSAKGYSSIIQDMEFDHDAFESFLSKAHVSENILFTSVFAYTLSKFTRSDKSLFTIIENGRDRFDDYDSIGMNANVLPILADCKNRKINSFMQDMSKIIYNVIRYNYYPYSLVARKYNFTANVLFQYLPDWIAINEAEENYDFSAINEIVFGNFNDFITEFGIQITQNEDNYSLIIIYSNNYTDELAARFVETYMSVLSGIIHGDLSDNIDDVLK